MRSYGHSLISYLNWAITMIKGFSKTDTWNVNKIGIACCLMLSYNVPWWSEADRTNCLGLHQRRGWVLSTKHHTGCAVNMGSKISLMVYDWPLIKCKIWYMNGSIFQNLTKIPKIGSNLRNFFGPGQLVYECVTPSYKNWYLYGVYFQIPRQHIPTKTKLEYPPFLGHQCST